MTDHPCGPDNDHSKSETACTDAHTGFRFDCAFCDAVFQTSSVDAIQDRGTTHLETHRSDLLAVFANHDRGKGCQNDCGYVFPVGVEEVAGFECPTCGYDNFDAFAGRYLYWQIEQP